MYILSSILLHLRLLARAERQEGPEDEVVADRLLGEHPPALRDVGDAPAHHLVGRGGDEVLALEGDGPLVGRRRLEMVFISVVLPAPLLPMTATSSPSATSRQSPFSARIFP